MRQTSRLETKVDDKWAILYDPILAKTKPSEAKNFFVSTAKNLFCLYTADDSSFCIT